MHQQYIAFQNIVGKGEIAGNEQFFLFPQCFLLNQKTVSPFDHTFDIISLFAAEFEKPKIGISCKGLKHLKPTLKLWLSKLCNGIHCISLHRSYELCIDNHLVPGWVTRLFAL